MRWCESQQENRLLWLGLALTGQGAVLMPLTVAAVLLTGFRFDFLMVALAAIALAVVTNLAALPTKITIPAFLLGIVMDLVVLTSCIIDVFNR